MAAIGKLRKTETGHAFWCFGCKEFHHLSSDRWQFNGDYDRPTFQPSVLLSGQQGVCHLFVTMGKIRYLTDCSHRYAGHEVVMREEESAIEVSQSH